MASSVTASAGAALLEPVDAALEAAEHLDDRVGQVLVVQVDGVDARALAHDDAAGNADHGAVRRHVVDDDRTAADLAAVTDGDVAEHGGTDAHDDAVLERRMALAGLLAGAAERDALVERDVVADDRRLADDDAHAVVDEEAVADGGARDGSRCR